MKFWGGPEIKWNFGEAAIRMENALEPTYLHAQDLYILWKVLNLLHAMVNLYPFRRNIRTRGRLFHYNFSQLIYITSIKRT